MTVCSPRFRCVSTLIAVTLSTACAAGTRHPSGDAVGALATLIAAEGGLARRFEPRTSIPWSGGECRALSSADNVVDRASCNGRTDMAPAALADFSASTRQAARTTPTPHALHALALIDLLWADSAGGRLDVAIRTLENARQLPGASPRIASDLAAAYLLSAEQRQDPLALVDAAESALAALAMDSTLAEARFNLALALSRLRLHQQAVREWVALQREDVPAEWRAELGVKVRADSSYLAAAPARAHTMADRAGHASYVRDHPQESRLAAFDTLLVTWARATVSGEQAVANDALDVARVYGESLQALGLDASVADAVAAIDAATTRAARGAMAAAFAAYGDGMDAYTTADFAAAADKLREVVVSAGASAPLRRWAASYLATCTILAGAPVAGLSELRALLAQVDSTRYPTLAARIHWGMATALYRDGRAAEGIGHLHTTRALFARAREREHEGITQHLEATYLAAIGEEEQAIRTAVAGLATLRSFRRSTWLQALLEVFADAVGRRGARHFALVAQRESAGVSRGIGNDLYLAPSLLALARREGAVGQRDAALRALGEVEQVVQRLPQNTGREWQAADLDLTRADVDTAIGKAEARDRYKRGIAFFTRVRNVVRVVPALSDVASFELAHGDVARAERALVTAVEALSRSAAQMTNLGQRAALTASSRRVFDQLVMIRLHHGDTRGALAAVERGRVPLEPADANVAVATARAAADEVIADYALVGDTLLAWVLVDTTLHLTRQVVEHTRLVGAIARLRTQLELGASVDEMQGDLQLLHRVMLRPVTDVAQPRHRVLTIVADGELADAPLSAARDDRDGRYVVERFALRFAESFADAVSTRPDGPPRGAAVLVRDPAFDRRRHPGLTPLPWAAAEVDSVTGVYHPVRLVAGAGATRDALTAALEGAQVLHFAGHTVFDATDPARSFLVLAPDSSASSGALDGREIRALRLRGVRLVVLSSCESARGGVGHAGGLAGLAGAFRIAGASGVLGSLWRVRDDVTPQLMIAFHQRFGLDGRAPEALREAQLALLRSSDDVLRRPSSWAGFRYVGR